MLDLFAGLGGASAAMRANGWDVVTVDIDPSFNCTHTADIVTLDVSGWGKFDLVWASPPCQEFSRHGMPWLRAKNPPPPSLALVESSIRIIRHLRPTWWVIENVRGASQFIRPLLGKPKMIGAALLWGIFPPLGKVSVKPHKERLAGRQRAERSMIPIEISTALERAITSSAVRP